MPEPLTIQLKTLTPLWTGGVDGTSDRLHATGIIGSLRWWYEAIVRGLGGYACDPLAEANETPGRAEFDTKAYEEAKKQGKSTGEAIQVGLKSLDLVTYLFGTTGWARLFQLQVLDAPTTPLHFVTSLAMNESWLKRIFGGESKSIGGRKVPYGDIKLRLVPRGYDAEYATNQLLLALRFAAEYGGVGARLQHGFGQVEVSGIPRDKDVDIPDAMKTLNQRLMQWPGPKPQGNDLSPFNLRYFVSQTYQIPLHKLPSFNKIVGTGPKKEVNYTPCAFDLRYKGKGKLGMRRWFEEEKGWKSSNAPKQLGSLDELMGPRSQWGPKGREQQIDDERRTGSRVFFGMPHRIANQTYQLRIFGFAPPNILTSEDLNNFIEEYMKYAFDLAPTKVVLGTDLVSNAQGVAS